MNEKKNLDKLFKEQLKNFEVAPKDHVWENIEERLHEDKRKRRVIIPIWWKVAGVAAGLILLFTVANQVFNSTEQNGVSKDIIVNDSNADDNLKSQEKTNTVNELNKPSDVILEDNSTEQIVDNNNTNTSVENEEDASVNKNRSNIHSTSENKNNTVIASENSNRLRTKEESQNSNTINSSNDFKKLLEEKKGAVEKPATKDAVANISKKSNDTQKDSQDLIKDKSELDKIIDSAKTDSNSAVADTNSKEKETSDPENNPIEDAQKENEEEAINAIENAIAEAEDTNEKEKEEEEEKLNRWSVSPNVAPVYFSSLGEGSSIDDQFINNTKESDINMSYGIAGSYTINKKLKIRAGINRVDLGYTTNDVLIFENSNENLFARQKNQISNVDVSGSVNRYSIYSSDSFNFENAPATLLTKEQGSLDQQLGFIEVPIEIEYTLVEKKLGVNLIGGFSTLFLNQNDIYAVFNNGDRARIGDASNVRDMSYSANFGIGLDYNFSNQWQFNLDPTFKYQINTFNNTSGDFQPFFIGVYTGLSFKF